VEKQILYRSYEGMKVALRVNLKQMSRPTIPTTTFGNARQEYDFYGSVVWRYGSAEAHTALQSGKTILVALRNSSSTLAGTGKGSYDDKIAVLYGKGTGRKVNTFPACTEPGAQYSQRAKTLKSGDRVDARYADVAYRKSAGSDTNKDGIKDAGRLIEGTYRYYEKSGGFLGDRAFQVKAKQIVERDTDGDGLFTASDPNRLDTKGAGTTMYIHRGGADTVLEPNTWSAGCQTIPKNHYKSFLSSVGAASASFYYVLVNT
jgi:hypothetical protein